jgi:putative endonuclease
LESRLKEHNWGNTKSTKPYIPWKIVHIEEFKSRAEARGRKVFKICSWKKMAKRKYKKGD